MEFPTTQEITHVIRNRVADPTKYIGRQVMPIKDVYAADIKVDVIGATRGMTKAHNLNSNPKLVAPPVQKEVRYGTGYWKETMHINEKELIEARMAGYVNVRAGRQLVTLRSIQLDTRLETRIEYLIWQALTTGRTDVDENGVKYAVDHGIPTKNLIDLAASGEKLFTDPDSDPVSVITDMMLAFDGTGGQAKTAYFNLKTAQVLATNKNIRDLLKYTNLTHLGVGNITDGLQLLIPGINFKVYNQGYSDESGVFHKFIPDGVIVMEAGDDDPTNPLGDFATTLNIHNGGIETPKPGKFAIVDDKSQMNANPHIDLTAGIYGLPRIYHPDWIVSAKVA